MGLYKRPLFLESHKSMTERACFYPSFIAFSEYFENVGLYENSKELNLRWAAHQMGLYMGFYHVRWAELSTRICCFYHSMSTLVFPFSTAKVAGHCKS